MNEKCPDCDQTFDLCDCWRSVPTFECPTCDQKFVDCVCDDTVDFDD
jgi:hypothetical protein